MMRHYALAMGAAVMAAAPVVMFGSINVHADFDGAIWADGWSLPYARLLETRDSVINSAEFQNSVDATGIAAFDKYTATIYAIAVCIWQDNHPANPAEFFVCQGEYITTAGSTDYHSAALLGRLTSDPFNGPYTVYTSDGGSWTAVGNTFTSQQNNGYVFYTSNQVPYTVNGIQFTQGTGYIYWVYYDDNTSPPVVDTTDPYYHIFYRPQSLTGVAPRPVLGVRSGHAAYIVPEDLGVIATPEDARVVLHDYTEMLKENYPQLSPFLPSDDNPVYPTEFVQGIPKSWTIENPDLPSYNLDLQLPTADFEAVDVSTPLEQNANGIRFWWAILGTLLDHFGLKSLVVLACALGLFLLVLTRLGR